MEMIKKAMTGVLGAVIGGALLGFLPGGPVIGAALGGGLGLFKSDAISGFLGGMFKGGSKGALIGAAIIGLAAFVLSGFNPIIGLAAAAIGGLASGAIGGLLGGAGGFLGGFFHHDDPAVTQFQNGPSQQPNLLQSAEQVVAPQMLASMGKSQAGPAI